MGGGGGYTGVTGGKGEGEGGGEIKTLCISGEYFNQTNTSAQQYKGPGINML